jgi:hypothetical protein
MSDNGPDDTNRSEGDLAVIVDKLDLLDLGPSQPPIYDRPIGLRLLHEDPTSGAEHYLVHYPPGLKALRHRHSAAQTIVVLEGKLEANGKRIGPGATATFRAEARIIMLPRTEWAVHSSLFSTARSTLNRSRDRAATH